MLGINVLDINVLDINVLGINVFLTLSFFSLFKKKNSAMRFNRGFLATIRFGQEYIFSFIEEASIMLKPILRLYTSR